MDLATFKKKRAGFVKWLEAHGALIDKPTNDYEVLRYRIAGHPTIVVYRNKRGRMTVPEIARDHYRAYLGGAKDGVINKLNSKRHPKVVKALLIRDGDDCCFCGQPLGDDISLEHWLPRSAGGGNDMRNLALAHKRCNKGAEDKSIVEKIAYRDMLRSKPRKSPTKARRKTNGSA